MSDPDSAFEGLGSLIKVAGINIPARARFIGETLIGATLSSLTFGLVCGQVGAITSVGPLFPFLCGSWFGYSFGLVGQWMSCKRLAKTYADKYPALLIHSLQNEWHVDVPVSVASRKADAGMLNNWIFDGGLGRVTMSILAAQACRASVEEIQQKGRERVAEQIYESGDIDDADDE